MSKSLSLSWSDARYGGLRTICESVESALAATGVDFYYLIGAQARDLWYPPDKLSSRITRDVDFAILAANDAQFTAVKQVLSKQHGYEEIHDDGVRLHSPDGTTVDILPFGEIEAEDRTVLGGQGFTSIHVDGFREVANVGTAEAQLDGAGGPTFRIATLPSIVLLKLISYDDRPDQRAKDPEDIAYIFSTYFDIVTNLFFYTHYDVLEGIDSGYAHMGARVIGREMRLILQQSATLDARVRGIVGAHIAAGVESKFIEIMARESGLPIEEAIVILKSLQSGLDEVAPA